MPKRKAGKILVNERKFVKKYIETGKVTEAALQTYNTKQRKNAYEIGKRVLQRPVVQEYLKQVLEKKGLSLEDSTDKLAKAVDYNLDNGKPSQAVGADLLKFTYKLLDAIPTPKTVTAKINYNIDSALPNNLNDLQKQLQDISRSNEALLKELKR